MPIEEPLSAASLAKRHDVLLGSVTKRRHVVYEDAPLPEPQPEATVGDEEEHDVDPDSDQHPPEVQSVGEESSPALMVSHALI